MEENFYQMWYLFLLQYMVNVQKGSGFFHVIPDQAGVVSLEYTDKTKQMQVNETTNFRIVPNKN